MDTAQIVRDLKTQEAALLADLGRIQSALNALEHREEIEAAVRSERKKPSKSTGRKLSAAGRAAISRAAKKRWAKHRRAAKAAK